MSVTNMVITRLVIKIWEADYNKYSWSLSSACPSLDHHPSLVMENTSSVVMLLPCVRSFFPPNQQISISVRGIVIMHRKLAQRGQRFTFPSLVLVSARWDLHGKALVGNCQRALLILARTPCPRLDDSAAKSLLDAIPNCPSGAPCCCQQQLPW